MGFYGNIGETNNIHFQFDKIFNSRTEMDLACANGTDHIYQGRFVLVRYDNSDSIFSGEVLYGFMKQNESNIMYLDQLLTNPYIYTTYQKVVITSVNINSIKENYNIYFEKKNINNQDFYIKLTNNKQVIEGKTLYKKQNQNANAVGISTIIHRKNLSTEMFDGKFYICIGQDSNGKALWELISDYEVYGNYLSNYQKDLISYGQFFDYRGYDGTVWEKIYSEGSGEYLQVARLNGSPPPAINIIEDKPTILPKSVYIDTNSSPDLYAVHVPAHWGFRIKEAIEEESPQSELNIFQEVYDENTQTIITEEFNADIYFNLIGKNHKLRKLYDNIWENEIKIRPTGMSGKKYNGQIEIDTYELSVHLPMIGNMISDGYDLIYGENEPLKDENDEFVLDDNDQKIIYRPRDVKWYSGDSPFKNTGNPGLGGKTYDLKTLAGTINTAHDILGQIIIELSYIPTDPEEVANYSEDYLYKKDDIYYRRGKKTIVEDVDETNFIYDRVNVPTAEQGVNFPANKYYKKVGSVYQWAREWEEDTDYYLKNIKNNIYTPVDLEHFVKGQYYTKEGEDYICDYASQYPRYLNKTYYKNIIVEQVPGLTAEYTSDGSFYTYENKTFSACYEEYPAINSTYYQITSKSPIHQVTSPEDPEPHYYYYPGIYYYQSNLTGEISLITDSLESFNPNNYANGTIWIYQFSKELLQGFDNNDEPIWYYKKIGEQNIGSNVLFKLPTTLEENPVTSEMEPRYKHLYIYYQAENKYIAFDKLSTFENIDGYNPYAIPRVLYELSITPYPTDSLFLPGAYYYIETIGDYRNYKKDKTMHLRDAPIWYKMTSVTTVTKPFYLPDKYWFEPIAGSNDFVISSGDYNNQKTYYTKKILYVKEDTAEQCPSGFKWNDYAVYIPPSITMCTFKEVDTFIEISELGENTNSLFGLLLSFQKLFSADDDESRDLKTIRGLYNALTDFSYEIKTLKPQKLLYTNNFGQIDSLEADPNKIFITDNYGHIKTISFSELKTRLNNA